MMYIKLHIFGALTSGALQNKANSLSFLYSYIFRQSTVIRCDTRPSALLPFPEHFNYFQLFHSFPLSLPFLLQFCFILHTSLTLYTYPFLYINPSVFYIQKQLKNKVIVISSQYSLSFRQALLFTFSTIFPQFLVIHCPHDCLASFPLTFMMLHERFHPISTILSPDTSFTSFQCAFFIFSCFPTHFTPISHIIILRSNTKVSLTLSVDLVYRNPTNLSPASQCKVLQLHYRNSLVLFLLFCALHPSAHTATHY